MDYQNVDLFGSQGQSSNPLTRSQGQVGGAWEKVTQSLDFDFYWGLLEAANTWNIG